MGRRRVLGKRNESSSSTENAENVPAAVRARTEKESVPAFRTKTNSNRKII